MRAFRELTWISVKLYIREPIATFFTLAFPPMLVLLFGAMYGNEPDPMFGGYGSMDVSMAGYSALILGTVGLLSVPITLSGYRERGVMRRLRATAMRPLAFIIADVVSNLLMTLAGMLFLVIAGWLLHRVRFEGQVISYFLGICLGGLAMFSFGYVIAGLAPSARTAQIVGMVIFYPMMFLSGAGIPLELMPQSIRRVSDFMPLTHVVSLLRGLWFGGSWGDHLLEVVVLAAVLVISAVLAARFFRWE